MVEKRCQWREHIETGDGRAATHFVRSRTFAFAALCAFFASTLRACLEFHRCFEQIFLDVWGSPENWYLQEYRSTSAGVWSVTRMLAGSAWFLGIPVAMLLLVALLNGRLSRDHARTLNLAVGCAWAAAMAVTVLCYFRLLQLPLALAVR